LNKEIWGKKEKEEILRIFMSLSHWESMFLKFLGDTDKTAHLITALRKHDTRPSPVSAGFKERKFSD